MHGVFVSLYNEAHSHRSAGTVSGSRGLRSCLEVNIWQWHLVGFVAVAMSPSVVPGVPGKLDNTFLPASRARAPSSVPQQCKPFYLGHLPGSRNRQGNSYVKLVWGWLKPTWTGLKWNNNLILSAVSPGTKRQQPSCLSQWQRCEVWLNYNPEIKRISSLDVALQVHQSSSVQLLVAELQVGWMGLVWQVCGVVVVGVCSWAEQAWVRSSQWRC